jgi:hypothetical protein
VWPGSDAPLGRCRSSSLSPDSRFLPTFRPTALQDGYSLNVYMPLYCKISRFSQCFHMLHPLSVSINLYVDHIKHSTCTSNHALIYSPSRLLARNQNFRYPAFAYIPTHIASHPSSNNSSINVHSPHIFRTRRAADSTTTSSHIQTQLST